MTEDAGVDTGSSVIEDTAADPGTGVTGDTGVDSGSTVTGDVGAGIDNSAVQDTGADQAIQETGDAPAADQKDADTASKKSKKKKRKKIERLKDDDGKSVRLTAYDLDEDKTLRVEIEFDNSTLYSAFNNRELYVGRIQQAADAGLTFPPVYATDGTGQASIAGMASEGKKTLVIFEEAVEIVTPKDIAYRSENVTVTDGKHAFLSRDGEVGYIIY